MNKNYVLKRKVSKIDTLDRSLIIEFCSVKMLIDFSLRRLRIVFNRYGFSPNNIA